MGCWYLRQLHKGFRVRLRGRGAFLDLQLQEDAGGTSVASGQREELEQEIFELRDEARAREAEIEELVGSSPF